MGDVVMTTPALRAIRAARPNAHLALLTSPAGAAVASLVDELDEVIEYEAPWLKPVPSGGVDAGPRPGLHRGSCRPPLRCRRRLHGPLAERSARGAGLPSRRIPLRLAHCRENPYHLLTDWVPDPEPDAPIRHEVQRQLDLVASVGYRTEEVHLSIRVPPGDSRRMRAWARDAGLGDGRPWLVAHPGASAPSRRYPAAGYARALRRLVREDGWRVVLTGDRSETDLVESIRQEVGEAAVSLAGELSIGELAALIAMAPLLVSNNTGPVHLAAAVATPVVVLYALTNLQHTPWSVPSRVLSYDVPCRGCRKSVCPLGHNACLRMVTPDEIVAAVRDLARETGVHGLRRDPVRGALPVVPLAPASRA